MTATGLSPDLERLVTETVGPVLTCERSASGASRITWMIETTRGPCVLREDPGDGPVAGTRLNLEREASAYRALAGTGVKIPRLLAGRDDAILMERAEGSPDLGGLSAESISSIFDSYIDGLADLHRVHVDSRFDALDPPQRAEGAAIANVALWADILNARVRRTSALAAFATRWLTDRAPRDAERLVVCHGDVGPGNFMHDGAALTAMLDWEFVHVGDPMDDLAWLAFRGHHMGGVIGDFDRQLHRWQRRTGLTVCRRRIAYYRVAVMYIWLVSCLAALDNGSKHLNRFTYLNLIALLNAMLPRAMMEFDGKVAPTVEVSLACTDDDVTESTSALVDLIMLTWPESDPGRGSVEAMARQVHGLARVHADVVDQNVAAVAELTGTERDPSYEATLAAWIGSHPEDDDRVLKLLYEIGCRRIAHDPMLNAFANKPFMPLDD